MRTYELAVGGSRLTDWRGWLWAGAVLALYLLMSVGFQYRARRKRHAEHPLRDAIHNVEARQGSSTLAGDARRRLKVAAGMVVVFPIVFIPSQTVRVVLLIVVVLVMIAYTAYSEYRIARRSAEQDDPTAAGRPADRASADRASAAQSPARPAGPGTSGRSA